MFKARMRFSKTDEAAYISHLDLMHCMQRMIARAQLPVWYTEGFNQHIYISIALPLSTGYSGACEFLDFNCTVEELPVHAAEQINAVAPCGLHVEEVYALDGTCNKVRDVAWSKYRITWEFDSGVPKAFCADVQEYFAQDEIVILKKSKRGEKEVNIKDLMRDLTLEAKENCVEATVITASGNNNLSPEYLTRAMAARFPDYRPDGALYHHMTVYTNDFHVFR